MFTVPADTPPDTYLITVDGAECRYGDTNVVVTAAPTTTTTAAPTTTTTVAVAAAAASATPAFTG